MLEKEGLIMPQKGEEMKSKSKGDFFDFVEDVQKDPRLLSRFLAGFKRCKTPRDLLNLFCRLGYEGVSLEDCKKMWKIIKNPKQLQSLPGASQY
jgi:hypothetical protein